VLSELLRLLLICAVAARRVSTKPCYAFPVRRGFEREFFGSPKTLSAFSKTRVRNIHNDESARFCGPDNGQYFYEVFLIQTAIIGLTQEQASRGVPSKMAHDPICSAGGARCAPAYEGYHRLGQGSPGRGPAWRIWGVFAGRMVHAAPSGQPQPMYPAGTLFHDSHRPQKLIGVIGVQEPKVDGHGRNKDARGPGPSEFGRTW
jgi:hypothetical protein